MESRFFGSNNFNKEKAESLKKLRIIQQNIIRVQGIPKSLANIGTLKSKKYFGQYGKIKNFILSTKINPENNKEIYSIYITYENKLEAACAILCVDSLLIFGKIIRAFFGTAKYCSHFLNNQKCPNAEKCLFLHQLVTNKDIIIDDNTNFSYNEHLNMSKKIIEQSISEIKYILSKPKNWKSRLPYIDFIFLNEEQKQQYLMSSDIGYIKNSDDKPIITPINSNNNNIIFNNNCNIINIYNINNIKLNINDNNNMSKNNNFAQLASINVKYNDDYNNLKDFNPNQNVNIIKYEDPFELYNIFEDSIKHILLSKPFFINIRNAPLKKMEYDYFKNDLSKKGIDINIVLKGCLDCIKDFM
jgi:hypothetical protein